MDSQRPSDAQPSTSQKSPHSARVLHEDVGADDEEVVRRSDDVDTNVNLNTNVNVNSDVITVPVRPDEDGVELLLQKTPSPRDDDEDCQILPSPVPVVPLDPTDSTSAPTDAAPVTSSSAVDSGSLEPDNIRFLRLQLDLERQLREVRSLPPPVQRSASIPETVSRPSDSQVAPPIGRDTLMSTRIPVNRDHVNQLSPVKSPFKRLMGSGRVRSSAPSSPSSLSVPEGQERHDDNQFRTAIKVLLDYMPDVASTAPREKAKLPSHFVSLYKATGKPKILLPPHPNVASNYQFVQNNYVDAKKTPSGQYKVTAKWTPSEVFEPKTPWNRAETSFNAGPDVSFLQRDRSVDNSAMKLFDFKSVQNFKQPLSRQYQLNKSSAQALIRNTKNGIASASYEAHFLEALKLNIEDMLSSLKSSSPPEGASDDVIDWFEKLQDQLTTSALRSELLLQGVNYSSNFTASFHVFNDVLETQFRRDQFLSHLKPFLQHHRLEMRDAPFDSSNVFPRLDDVLSQADQETAQSANFAIADALAAGWRSGQSGASKNRQDNRSRDRDRNSRSNRSDSRRGNSDNNRNRSRSRNRADSGQRVRQDYNSDSQRGGRGGYNQNQSRNFQSNRGNYQSRSSRRNQRRQNVPEGSQDQQPKSQQSK